MTLVERIMAAKNSSRFYGEKQPFKINCVMRGEDGAVHVFYRASFWDGSSDGKGGYYSQDCHCTKFKSGRWNGVSPSVSYFAELQKAAA